MTVLRWSPEVIDPPSLSGAGTSGQPLICSPGVWRASPAPTFQYQWKRDREDIPGKITNSYTPVVEDEQRAITCQVTATNDVGSTTVESAIVFPIAPVVAVPTNTVAPAVSGIARMWGTLYCSTGTWTGSPRTYTYAWTRNGFAIPNATRSTYVVTESDIDQAISCAVTAANRAGSAKQDANTVVPSPGEGIGFDPTGWHTWGLADLDPQTGITVRPDSSASVDRWSSGVWSPHYGLGQQFQLTAKLEPLSGSGTDYMEIDFWVGNDNPAVYPGWDWFGFQYFSDTRELVCNTKTPTPAELIRVPFDQSQQNWLRLTITGGDADWLADPAAWTLFDRFGPAQLVLVPNYGLMMPDDWGGGAQTPAEWENPALVRSYNYREDQLVVSEGLIARYLTEDISLTAMPDSFGNYDGTIDGVVSKGGGNIGRTWKDPEGNSYYFNGTDTAGLGDLDGLGADPNPGFTVQFWIQPDQMDDMVEGERRYILSKLNGDETEGWAIWIEAWMNPADELVHRIAFGRFGEGQSEILYGDDANPITNGFFIFSYDGLEISGNNGNAFYRSASTLAITNGTDALIVGDGYVGRFQDLAIHSRGVDAAEMTEMYGWTRDAYDPFTYGYVLPRTATDVRIATKWNSGYWTRASGYGGSQDVSAMNVVLRVSADKQKFIQAGIYGNAEGTNLNLHVYPTDYAANPFWDDFEVGTPNANATVTGIFADPRVGPASSVTLTEADFPGCGIRPYTDYWLVAEVEGNRITLEHWTTDPDLGGSPFARGTITMTAPGNVSAPDWRPKIGAGKSGQMGIGWMEPSLETIWNEFKVFNLANGQPILPASLLHWEVGQDGVNFTELVTTPWPFISDSATVNLDVYLLQSEKRGIAQWTFLKINDDILFDVTLAPIPPVPTAAELLIRRAAPKVSPLSQYKFELARSMDMGRIGELGQARNRSLQLALNRAGAFSCDLPLDDPLTDEVQEITTCIVITRDEEVIWSGPIWTLNENVSSTGATVQVGAVGWLQTLDKRVVRGSWNANQAISYTDQDAGVIALDLIARTNADAIATGAPIYIFPGESETTQLRTRTYQPWSGILQSITELTEIEAGFDMSVDPLTRRLNIYSRIGVNHGILFELPGNVAQVSRSTDAGRLINYMTAYSAAGSQAEANADSINQLGLFEEAQSLSDVVGPRADLILSAYAAGEILVKSWPLRFIAFQPMAESVEQPFAPRAFRDFNVGDIVRLTVRHGRMSMIQQALRMFAFSVSFPDTGGAAVSEIQTVSSG